MERSIHRRTRTVLGATAVLGALVAAPLTAQDPYEQEDETWITIDGTVTEVWPDAFGLNYGDGSIVIEMDDGDRDADAYKLVTGDEVLVSGRVDDDFFELATIEAGSVYVESIGTWFFASYLDDEERSRAMNVPTVDGTSVLSGYVTDVSGESFTLRTGESEVVVETHELPYDPLDGEGYLRVVPGDVVSVGGYLDVSVFEGRTFIAEDIVEIVG